MSRKMELVYQDKDIKLYQFEPDLFHLFKYNLQNHSVITKVRYLLDFLQKGHYAIYYMFFQDNLIGECVITPGGRRLRCSTNKDIVIGGPYYIIPDKRGQGFSEKLIKLSLQYCKYDWIYAFDYIKNDNIPSIKTTQKCGFIKYGELNIDKISHKMTQVQDNGRFYIFRLEHRGLEMRGDI